MPDRAGINPYGAKVAIMRAIPNFCATLAPVVAGAVLLVTLSFGAAALAESVTTNSPDSARSSSGPSPDDPRPDWHLPVWRQVRIMQRFSIRITPGTAAMPPAVVTEVYEDRIVRVVERKIGKCLGIGNIASVRAGDNNQLLLFLHDQRVISAVLEKRCSARDFYSGFYVDRNADGAICVGRDRLQSRSGANCRLKRFNELLPAAYRRFP